MDDFTVHVDMRDGCARLSCAGELDVAATGPFRESVELALVRHPDRVHVDATGVTFISAAGITALVDLVVECRGAGIHADLVVSERVRSVLDLVGLWWLGVVEDGISIHESLQKALRCYAEQVANDVGAAGPLEHP